MNLSMKVEGVGFIRCDCLQMGYCVSVCSVWYVMCIICRELVTDSMKVVCIGLLYSLLSTRPFNWKQRMQRMSDRHASLLVCVCVMCFSVYMSVVSCRKSPIHWHNLVIYFQLIL